MKTKTNVSLGLLLLLVSTDFALAKKRGDLSRHQQGYTYGNFAKLKENDRRPTSIRRASKLFHQVIQPLEEYFSPNHEKVTFFRRSKRWELTPKAQGRPRPIENPSHARTLWLRFHLARIPRTAVIEKAQLRMSMWPRDLKNIDPEITRAHLAFQTDVPERLERVWHRNVRGEGTHLNFNFPGLWWDIKEFARLAQPTGDIFRPFGLAIENAGQFFERDPEIHIWYRLPVGATAE